MIRLEAVTPDNWREELRVSETQERYVSDAMRLLARAYAYRDSRSRAYLICADETPVGMALYYDCDALQAYDLSQLFIDSRFQGMGFGIEAARQLLAEMSLDGKFEKVVLCYVEGNNVARSLFEKLGFSRNGERDGDEIVMEKAL